MFINELLIYIAHLKNSFQKINGSCNKKKEKYFSGFYNHLLTGINYYRQIVKQCSEFSNRDIENFNYHLDKAELELEAIFVLPILSIES
jgi:hypothetical protein